MTADLPTWPTKRRERASYEEGRQRAARQKFKKASASELLRYGDSQRRWYFGKLELHPIKLNLTFKANNNWGESGSLPIPNIDQAPLWLSASQTTNSPDAVRMCTRRTWSAKVPST